MPSLVLIPGLLCDHRLWSHQITNLAKYADVTIANITQQQTASEMAEAVVQSSPDHFFLAGFSLGSQVALEVMCRSKCRVEGLALLSATHGGLPPPVEAVIRHALSILESGDLDQYLEAAYPAYVAPSHVEDPVLKRCFMQMAHTVGGDAGIRQMRALLAITSPFG